MRCRVRTAVAACVISLLLGGCESIILDADLDKATVEMYTVPSVNLKEGDVEESWKDLQEEKYRIEGKSAFYILPVHRPAPENIIDFKMLDLVDGTTTVYAYQAIYNHTDQSGLGGAAKHGSSRDTSNAAGTVIKNAKNMATILMTYNTDTGEYRVLFHQVTPCDKSAGKDYRQEDEIGSFFAQKTGRDGDRYFFYSDGIGYVFKQNGELIYQRDVRNNLDYNCKRYGGEGAVMTLTNVVCDQNYFMYMTMNIEKAKTGIDENTTEEDLENEDSGVVQLSYAMYEYDIGEPQNPGKDQKRYFVSENQNYQEQVKLWKKDDKKTIDLGLLEEEPDLDTVYASGKLAGESAIRIALPDTYGTYHYYDPDFNMKLSYYRPKDELCFWNMGEFFYQSDWYQGYAVLEYANPENMDQYQPVADWGYAGDEKKVRRAFVAQLGDGKGQTTKMLLDSKIQPEQQSAIVVTYPRSITVKWSTKKESTTGEGENTVTETTEEDHSKQIQETGSFVQQYELRFRGSTLLSWSQDSYTSDMLAPSPGTGAIRYGAVTAKYGEQERMETHMSWENGERKLAINGIPGAAMNAMLYEIPTEYGEQTPMLVAVTTDGVAAYKNFAEYGVSWMPLPLPGYGAFIRNRDISFGLTSQSSLTAQLDHIENLEVTVSEDGSTDQYDQNSILFHRENGQEFLYLAGMDSGIVKYNLSASRTAYGKAGQISPFPYYGIWEDNNNRNRLYAIGFESSEYAYSRNDICSARLYQIDLTNPDTAATLAASAIIKDERLRDAILRKDSHAWGQMLRNLGISHLGERTLATVNLYREYLMDDVLKKQAAIARFYDLAGIPAAERTGETSARIEACSYASQLETLMVELKLPELIRIQSDQIADGVEDETLRKQEQKKELDQISREYDGAEQLRLRVNMTQEQWQKELETIAANLRVPESIEEFLKEKAADSLAEEGR
ncbi:MAG: hypothetical protein Q4F28_14605 [Eubacteriales bacterium]|nr:hypothetical protein [Eubacteriales bacterium]